MKAEQPGQDCSCGFIRAGTSDVQRKPGRDDESQRESSHSLRVKERRRLEKELNEIGVQCRGACKTLTAINLKPFEKCQTSPRPCFYPCERSPEEVFRRALLPLAPRTFDFE
jgi:hypothetical protein